MAGLSDDDTPDVVLIGAGIMSATFGTVLKELEPSLRIAMFETLHDCAQESSEGWNNAGTGHAANCELNYTPQRPDGSVDIAKALEVNTEFDISRQLWAHLVRKGAIPDPRAFIHPCPHMSFVWGAENVAFLKARYAAMSAHHCYHGMEYSEDPQVIAGWAPLIIEGRAPGEPIAATRIVTGTDVDYGALTHLLVKQLAAQPGFSVHYNRKVVALDRVDDGRWAVTVEDTYDGTRQTVTAKFVFIGAGGGSLPLLQASKIPEGRGYGGFPVSGIWLRCDVDAVSARHHAKVYGKAASGSPPMSVPHLDTRIIGGKRSLLFGPYAGFSSRFLKHGALTDLFTALTPHNIVPLLDVAKDNVALTEYLVGQVLQSSDHQFATLKQFFPKALKQDWTSAVAGQRVQTIKPTGQSNPLEEGYLEFGTELVAAADHSICALLGASPGASTAAFIAVEVLEKCFADRLTPEGWLPRLKAVIPTYGIDLKQDAEACRRSRAETAPILRIDTV
ncbi:MULTISPECIES: malate dehydrogenase (quinone) [Methylobacterium]|uniref:Probable malate:quinone oxidoreductase n=2 Tax=Methylobacterium TaxID=407 RepID=A0AAE8HQJ4_9HYPH|nr:MULTISPECIES: malate dehydrogenase (quinone) [Methylobacterium]KOX54241.1 malate:quinone oxidoreductase [Streptomyces purpurogeneiscleroticus]APT33605.1 putative malate:quinone oxidoreductase [Methylobacterium phyllosphaerae]MBA9061270.1 malate dehydrogenase (quinone) [Methylobacterium fujisawaense]MDE4910645.1 malate dehydrogenase (quinone) [Methylobacterium sp. 092160098-2]MDH3030017.1 malate dehydrogenase (quinone) [Methylobacterium fujisawaense]